MLSPAYRAWVAENLARGADEAEVRAALVERGVDHDRIHVERFTAGRPSAALAAEMAQLQQAASGLTVNVTIEPAGGSEQPTSQPIVTVEPAAL